MRLVPLERASSFFGAEAWRVESGGGEGFGGGQTAALPFGLAHGQSW